MRALLLAVLALAIAALSAAAVARDAFGTELHPGLGVVVDAYGQWLTVGTLSDSAFLASGALPYWKHVFILLLLSFATYAVPFGRSHAWPRAAFAWA